MKVLQINSVYGFASTGKIVGSIHDFLLKNNVESFVIYARKTPKNVNMHNVFRIYSPLGTAIHAALAVIFDTHGLHSKFTTKKIIKKIEEIDPDIIHLHVIHGFYLNYPMLFAYLKQSGKKVIWTLHDCWEYTGYCAYYDYNECFEWEKHECKKCRYRNTYPYRLFSHARKNYLIKKACYENLDMVLVSCSRWLDGEVSKSMLKDKKHIVINNSVNLDNFYQEDSEYKERYNLRGKIILLAAANVWTKQKGMEELIKLAHMLDNDYQLVILGLNDKQKQSLPNNILGFKRVDIDELRKWYSCADVFLNFTLEDNYPTVNLEAKACGLPIITYRTGGSVEMLSDNDYIVEKYDLNSVIKILKDATFRKQVYKVNNSMENDYLSLYEKMINR